MDDQSELYDISAISWPFDKLITTGLSIAPSTLYKRGKKENTLKIIIAVLKNKSISEKGLWITKGFFKF